jgi:hypothetical protein
MRSTAAPTTAVAECGSGIRGQLHGQNRSAGGLAQALGKTCVVRVSVGDENRLDVPEFMPDGLEPFRRTEQ